MKVLQICPRMPYPPHDGGAIAMYDVLYGLNKAGHEVTVFTINTPKHHQEANVVKDIAKKCIAVDVNTKISYFKAFLNLFKKVPYNFERFINKEVSKKLIDLVKSEQFDILQVEGAQVAYYIKDLKQHTSAPVVMRAHNVESKIWERLAKFESNGFKQWYFNYLSKGIKWYEHKYLNQFDKIIAITVNDKNLLERQGIKTEIEVVPAGFNFDRITKGNRAEPPTSLFMIGDLGWKPNEEGLKWFLKHVWGIVSKACPDLKLHIAGKNAPKWLTKKMPNNVKYHGFVDSAEEFMASYDVMLVPLLSGSGMRLKIIEGMAMGKPIVSTYVGAEGIECADNKNIYIRDKVEDWVKLLSAYGRGKIDSKQISKNAMSFVKEIHDNDKIIHQFVSIYNSLK